MFDLNSWLTSLLFTSPSDMQNGGTGSEISQHFSSHGIKSGIGSSGLKDGTNITKVGFVSGSECNASDELGLHPSTNNGIMWR